MSKNRITSLFGIRYPIIQAGMIWCSGWKLAAAVSNSGGLGLIGAGSMYPDVLAHHIDQIKSSTSNPYGVNIPLLYPDIEELVEIVVSNKVPIVFTSAGNPKTWTQTFKKQGVIVVHVVSSARFALKAADCGVDAVVAEGFEAGGHNGRDETTTMCLVPHVRTAVDLPLIAAGGIGSGKSMAAAIALGADGVQIGSRFAVAEESSAHVNFKQRVIEAGEGDTQLSLKKLAPVRLLKNEFFEQVYAAENSGASREELLELLGRARAKKGIFEGNLMEGELEIGQVSGMLSKIQPAAEILEEIWTEYEETIRQLCKSNQ